MRSIVPLFERPRTARGCARGGTGAGQDSVLSQVSGAPVRKLRKLSLRPQIEVAIEVLSGYGRSVASGTWPYWTASAVVLWTVGLFGEPQDEVGAPVADVAADLEAAG